MRPWVLMRQFGIPFDEVMVRFDSFAPGSPFKARLAKLWEGALSASGGPFLLGAYSIADAFFAPVVGRCRSYSLPLPSAAQRDADNLWASWDVAQWVAGALAEHDFLAFEEPYRAAP